MTRCWSVSPVVPGLALVLTLLVSGSGPATAEIIDTLAGFERAARGWSGGIALGMTASGGNTERIDFSSSARTQWFGADHRWRLIGGYARAESEGKSVAESGFGHLRHNRRLNDRLWSLAFTQVSHDPFQRLRSRILLGAGVRVPLLTRETQVLAVGAAHMLEWERLEALEGSEFAQRLSAFLDAESELREGVALSATGFFQPLWEDLGDFRGILNARVEVELASRLDLAFGLRITHDSNPPADVEETDWSLRTGLEIDL